MHVQITDEYYSEGVQGRALATPGQVAGAMTVALCVQACKTAGFSFAGIEYAAECCQYSSIRFSFHRLTQDRLR